MEIRIYRSLDHFTKSKPFYCARVECPDAFSAADALSVFRSIYGTNIIIVFIYA